MNLSIQYLRGLAALLVVFVHFSYGLPLSIFCGAIGVDIFFFISGFIMSETAERYKENKLLFIKNRIIRIYPLYLILLIPVLLLFALSNPLNLSTIIKSILFFGGNYYHYQDPILFSGWTLLFEFIFYFIIITFSKSKRMVNIILLAMGSIGLLFPIETFLGIFFNQFYLYFLIGMNLKDVLSHFKPKIPLFHLILSVILILMVMLFKDKFSTDYLSRQFVTNGSLVFPRAIFWGIPCFYFVISFIRYTENLKANQILKYVGDRSYSIYLVHTVLYILMNNEIVRQNLNFMPYNFFKLILISLLFPISELTYSMIEMKLSKRLKSI